ncbi:MAG: ABC transporter substrate-binding protein [Armatimonadota bacterium]
MRIWFKLASIAVVALMGLPLAATRAPAGPASDTLVVLQGVDATTLDPHQYSSLPEVNIMLHIFETLVELDDDMRLVPKLAESYRNLASDWHIWEFKLRPNLRFSNGEPLDASAVKFSFDRGLNPQIGRGNTAYLNNNLKIREVRVIDPLTVQIVTTVTSPVVPNFLTEYEIVPPKYYSETPLAQVATRPVGSGPYVLREWRKDEQVVLEVDPNYWGPRPRISRAPKGTSSRSKS